MEWNTINARMKQGATMTKGRKTGPWSFIDSAKDQVSMSAQMFFAQPIA